MSDDNGSRDADGRPPAVDAATFNVRDEVLAYLTGFALSVLLTVASFYILHTNLIWGPGIAVALVVLAIAQIGVQLVFFLHLTTAPDNTNNAMALAFGVLIVLLIIGGSIWIMDHLNERMMPMDQIMQMQR
jgi:cytochrome o ubiquinol oxidase subunit IV